MTRVLAKPRTMLPPPSRPVATSVRPASGALALSLDKIDGKDSDHSPLLFSAGGLTALSWNVCFRYRVDVNRGFVNNGFGRRDELPADYEKRLARTAANVEQMVRSSKPPFVCLQEVPEQKEPSRAGLLADLERRMAPLGYQLFASGDRVTLVRGKATRVALPELERQGKSTDAFLVDEPRALLVNVHWQFDLRGSDGEDATRADFHDVIDHLQAQHPGVPIFVVGDTNRVASSAPASEAGGRIDDVVEGRGVIVTPHSPSSVRFDVKARRSEMTWADFGIYVAPRGR